VSIPKSVWTFSADDFTKLIDAELEARLSPWTDGNRSLRIRFLYKLSHQLLCSSTPEKVNEIIADLQRLTGITSQQRVPAVPQEGKGPTDAGHPNRPPLIDGFLGGSHREFDLLLATAAGVH